MSRSSLSTPFLGLIWLAALAAGCRSTPPPEVRRLPVHVAILPVAEPTIGQVTQGELPGEDTDIRLDLDRERIGREVAGALEEYCFARATLLEEGAHPFVDAFEREAALLDLARAQGADWILELALRYDRELYRENTGTFWLNYPLFLFAGPTNWFLPDNRYSADVELRATIYDLHAIGAAGGGLGDPVTEVVSVTSRYAGEELNFVERSTGFLDYAKGIVIPSGHLARESEDVEAEIVDDIVASLPLQLVQSLQSRHGDLVRSERIAPVFVEPADVRVTHRADDLHVQGRVLLRDDGLAQSIRAVHLDAGAGRVTVEPRPLAGEGPPGCAAFGFEAPVAAADGARYLRLECEAGSRDRYVRSYTFRIWTGDRNER